MAQVFEGQRTSCIRFCGGSKCSPTRSSACKEDVEQRWTHYTASLLSFSIFGFLLTVPAAARAGIPAFNPQHFSAANVPPDLAFNTATSFVTNTNWQAYSGESTMSYFVQMAALAVQNFASAAAGIADRDRADPRLRAPGKEDHRQFLGGRHTRHGLRAAADLDRRRSVLVSQGVIQNLQALHEVTTVEGAQADDRAGTGGVAGSHQATRHQRRRLLQRQFLPSIRESDSAEQPARDVPDLRDSRGADLHLRARWSATRGKAGRFSRPSRSCS